MSAIASLAESSVSALQPLSRRDQETTSELDASVSLPVLTLFFFALAWLVGWSVLNLVLALKLVAPDFLGGLSWLSYGRLEPVSTSMFAYGWASCAGMGAALWIMARLCRVKVGAPGVAVVGTLIWNIGLAAGIAALHGGLSRGLEFLELPGWSHVIMLAGFTLIALWIVALFRGRAPGEGYISQTYLVAAFLWMAWSMLAANAFMALPDLKGVGIAINHAWFAGNLTGFWFTALALGAAYYFIPKVTGKPLYSQFLANAGFWTFALFAGFTGMQRYNGGPIPAWLITCSIVATFLAILPVGLALTNYQHTLSGSFGKVAVSPTLRFMIVGLAAYMISALSGAFFSLRGVSQKAGLTLAGQVQTQLVLYAFFSMIMFGAIYYIVPRLVRREWISATFIKMHFLGSMYGIGLSIVVYLVAGLFQGASWNTATIASETVAQTPLPLLRGAITAGALLLIGHVLFAFHYLLMLARFGQVSLEPTLLNSKQAEAHH